MTEHLIYAHVVFIAGRQMRTFNTRRAFTLLEIMIITAIIGILASLAIPNFLKAREHARKHVCIENLIKMEEAKQMFAVEHKMKGGDVVSDADLFGPDLYIKKKPECPTGGSYELNLIGTNAECSLGPTLGHVIGGE